MQRVEGRHVIAPLDRIDVHGAQRPKMLSSLFHVDVHLHHDVKVQY